MFGATVAALLLHALLFWVWMNYTVADRQLHALAGRPVSNNGIEVTLSAAPQVPKKPAVTQLVEPAPRRPTERRQRTVLATTRTTTAPDVTAAVSLPVPDTPPTEPLAQQSAVAEPPSVVPSLPAPAVPQLNLPGAEVVRSVSQLACDIPQPRYPPAARRRQQEGTVTLRVSIDRSGAIGEVVVSASSGHELLDAAAVAALRQGHCQPYVENGVRIGATAELPVGFSLKR